MVILLWIISVIIIAVLIGEIRFQKLKSCRKNKKFNIETWANSINKDMDALDIENDNISFVQTTKLAMRGSWRLAQDLSMDLGSFAELQECEYSKSLH